MATDVRFIIPTALNTGGGSAPLILFTDITHGPTSTGENGNGAYLSIFGYNFGSVIGDITVVVGAAEVAVYNVLENAKAQPPRIGITLQKLTVEVGSLGGLAAGSSGAIKLTLNGQASNTDHTFTNQPGTIYYVDKENGNNGNAGTHAAPFRDVQTTDDNAAAWGTVVPGDFIVIMDGGGDGVYDETGGYASSTKAYFCRNRVTTANSNAGGIAPTGSASTGFISIMPYPGHDITLQNLNTPYPTPRPSGLFVGSGTVGEGDYMTISNFHCIGDTRSVDSEEGTFFSGSSSDSWRVVNNEIEWATTDTEARSSGVGGELINSAILGNHIHDIGGGTKNHGFYVDSNADETTLAWNYVHDVTGGNLFQCFDSVGSSPIGKLYVHNNFMHDGTRYGLNFSTSLTDLECYNNIVYDSAFSGLRFSALSTGGTAVNVFHNTFWNVATGGSHDCIDHDGGGDAPINIENNIFYPAAASTGYYSGSGDTNLSMDYNIWYGEAAGVPTKDSTNGLEDDPEFVSETQGNENLALQATSPAIGYGKTVTLIGESDRDLIGNLRTNFDCGALEYQE